MSSRVSTLECVVCMISSKKKNALPTRNQLHGHAEGGDFAGGGGGGRVALYISMGRGVPTKGILFSVCLERGYVLL